jgi:ATP-dependent RNA helicase RhlE
MLDMGFIPDVKRILALMPKQRQNMLFSATFSSEIRGLAANLLNKPGCIDIAPRNTASELVQQSVHLVGKNEKRDLLSHLIRHNEWQQVLVFTRTKHGANRLTEKLQKDGIAAVAIHGNKSQAARTRALADFKRGEVSVLVATDIAARGLDIRRAAARRQLRAAPRCRGLCSSLSGEPGVRASAGAAVSLVDAEEIQLLRGIEKLINRTNRARRRGRIRAQPPQRRAR